MKSLRELNNYVTSLLDSNTKLQEENAELKTKVKDLKVKEEALHNDDIIREFKKESMSKLKGLSVGDQRELTFKILKRLLNGEDKE